MSNIVELRPGAHGLLEGVDRRVVNDDDGDRAGAQFYDVGQSFFLSPGTRAALGD